MKSKAVTRKYPGAGIKKAASRLPFSKNSIKFYIAAFGGAG